MPSREEATVLRRIVRERRVYYEVEPEVLVQRDERIRIGFELKLWATHPRHSGALPGCPQCLHAYADLENIAQWILPREERASRYEIEPFNRQLYDSKTQNDTDEICLTLAILHREGFDRPVDACEERCLEEMKNKLGAIGVHEGRWRASPAT